MEGVGCQSPYSGPSCQCSVNNSVLGLEVSTGRTNQLSVTWQQDLCVSNYTLDYSLISRLDSCSMTITPTTATPEPALSGQNSHYIVTGLEDYSVYTVCVTPMYDNMVGHRACISGITWGDHNRISK